MYHVRLKDKIDRAVSFVHINPGISACVDHWMKVDNDFALVQLAEPIKFSEKIRPLCLPSWNQSWWDDRVTAGESILQPGEVTLVSGWICSYHSALRQHNALFKMEVLGGSKCKNVWMNQADYSEEEEIKTEYVNRICGTAPKENIRRHSSHAGMEEVPDRKSVV